MGSENEDQAILGNIIGNSNHGITYPDSTERLRVTDFGQSPSISPSAAFLW